MSELAGTIDTAFEKRDEVNASTKGAVRDAVEAALSLLFAFYNFCRPHMTLKEEGHKRTPAMAAGLTDHVWSAKELIERVVPREMMMA